MSQTEPWTIGRLLIWTTDYLKQHGSESPRLDAEVLLAESRGCRRIDLYTAFDQIANDATRTAFRELVRRRAEGTPVAYLVGHREFFSLRFRVSPDVLIPRPETELLVVRLLDLAKHPQLGPHQEGELSIADVGTGSGIIAVCAAKHIGQSKVTAIDADAGALAVARQNAADHNIAQRIEFVQSDLFAAVAPERKFHVIAANLPYVSEAEFAALSPTVRDFEPRLALRAGERGTEIIERLLPQAASRLEPGGWLLLEISPMIEPAVRTLIQQHGCYELGPTIKDLAGQPRVVQARVVAGP